MKASLNANAIIVSKEDPNENPHSHHIVFDIAQVERNMKEKFEMKSTKEEPSWIVIILCGISLLVITIICLVLGFEFDLFKSNWRISKRIEKIQIVKKVSFDNHQYIVFSNGEIIHDPDCK